MITLSLASGTGAKGGAITLALSITATGGDQCTTVEWSFGLTSDLVLSSVTLGAAGAGKVLNQVGNQIVVGGFDRTVIPNGVLVNATFNIAANPSASLILVTVSGISASDVNANALTTSGTSGTITIPISVLPHSGGKRYGLTINPTTGEITGIPDTAGTFNITYKVTDANGLSATITCPLTILPGILVYVLNYRELDSASQIASAAPIHTSFTGRLIATDHNRKWTRWNIPPVGAALMYRDQGRLQPVFWFGGNAYTLDADKLTDDDLGQIYPYYTTYFFVAHDQEMGLTYVDVTGQRMPLGSGRKLLAYLKFYCAGTGQITVTPFVDQLKNPWVLVCLRTLSQTPAFDLEWGGGQAQGDRIALQFASSPVTGTDNSFSLQRLTAFMKRAQRTQVRGSN